MTTLVTTRLVHMECYKCHVTFGMTDDHYNRCRDVGDEFFCPNGHCQVFGKSRVKQLEDKLAMAEARAQQNAARADRNWETVMQRDRTLAATRGHHTRLKKRVNHGVCPHCQRSFKSLREHIAHMHPEQLKEKSND